MRKVEIRPGRAASGVGVLFGAIAVLFAVFWLVLLARLAEDDNADDPGVLFLRLFGMLFLVGAVAVTIFYARSAWGRKRPAILEIEAVAGEPGSATGEAGQPERAGFCPHCGKELRINFSFCPGCGRKREP